METFRNRGGWAVLAVLAFVWFLGKFLRYAFPPLFDPLQATYAPTNTQIGAAFTGLMTVYALVQLPAGILADRMSGGVIIAGGAAIATGSAFILSASVPLWLFVVGMGLVGLGTGVHKTVSIRVLARAYPNRTGMTLGVFDTAGTAGGIVAPVGVAALFGLGGTGIIILDPPWRFVFLLAGILGIAGVAGSYILLGGETAPGPGGIPTLRDYAVLASDPQIVGFVGVTVLFGFAYNGIVAFLPLYLIATQEYSPALASLLYAVLFGASLVQLVSGTASDYVGRLPVITFVLGLGTLSLVLLLMLTGASTIIVALVVLGMGLGMHGFRPVRGAYWTEILPATTGGGGLGGARMLLMGAGAIAPAIVGASADWFGYEWAFTMLALVLGGSWLLATVLLVTVRWDIV